MVHRDDSRAEPLRALGADVVVGDLTEPRDVINAMNGADRVFFSIGVLPDYLKANAITLRVKRSADSLTVKLAVSHAVSWQTQ
jgi:uncharacterized protein YbjT (DUF2867 family)